jgi:hypothetical protein
MHVESRGDTRDVCRATSLAARPQLHEHGERAGGEREGVHLGVRDGGDAAVRIQHDYEL